VAVRKLVEKPEKGSLPFPWTNEHVITQSSEFMPTLESMGFDSNVE